MSNFDIKIDLLKLKQTGILGIKGKDGKEVRCLVIPVWENDIYVVKDEETGKPKKAYLNMSAYESTNKEYSSHYLKQSSFGKAYIERHRDDKEREPILGNMKLRETKGTGTATISADTAQVVSDEDIPF